MVHQPVCQEHTTFQHLCLHAIKQICLQASLGLPLGLEAAPVTMPNGVILLFVPLASMQLCGCYWGGCRPSGPQWKGWLAKL